MDDLAEHLALCERLAAELKRVGLHGHVERLRVYYRATRAGGTLPGIGAWDREHVINLCRTHRVPPHENDYPVRPRMSKCACSTPRTITHGTHPGGITVTCDACHEIWIELTE